MHQQISKKIVIYLFLFICLAIRIGFVLIAKFYNSNLFGIFGLFIGFLFLYNFLMVKKDGKIHKKIWWQNFRLVHSLNYLTFAILTFTLSSFLWSCIYSARYKHV